MTEGSRTASERPPLEPLFAHNRRLWLRVWATTQAAALIVSSSAAVANAGGLRPFLAAPSATRSLTIIALLGIYHLVGLRGHDWILRRAWAVFLFVPAGWVLILASLQIGGTFGLFIFGAIIQGFIFLPFTWAIITLSLVVLLIVVSIAGQASRQGASLSVARAGAALATGIMIGTVMLYIHRANRDSAIRARLLRQLDDAQRDLAERAKEAGVQEERQRLARDIHDTLAQGFTSVIKHLEAIELSFDSSHADVVQGARPHLAHAQAVSRSSLGEIRRLVWSLQPPQLAETTLAAAIERIVSQWSEANGVAATCTIDVLPPLQPDAEVIFLRATQEALSNVAKHASAARVAVTMQCVDGLVLLSIEDDGRGFVDVDADRPGKMGITGMRARVRPFGGHVLVESSAGGGTSVTVAMPLAAVGAGAA